VQETAAVAHTLALAEPTVARLVWLNEATPAEWPPDRNSRGKTTCEATLLLPGEPLAIPLLPFMHNVLAKRRAAGAPA
jgi:hypothetical protein